MFKYADLEYRRNKSLAKEILEENRFIDEERGSRNDTIVSDDSGKEEIYFPRNNEFRKSMYLILGGILFNL